MRTSTYLTFDGRCEEAFEHYAKALGGKIEVLMRYAGTPGEDMAPPDWRDKVMHATLTFGGNVLMASDDPPERHQPMQGFSVSLQCESVAEAERAWDALSEGGTVQMPLEETFWAARFGIVIDRFGTPWMINCDKPE